MSSISCFAAKLRARANPPPACSAYRRRPALVTSTPWSANIEKFFETGQAPYPVERTLLTTGILDALMQSHQQRGDRLETPEMEVRYPAPADSGFVHGNIADFETIVDRGSWNRGSRRHDPRFTIHDSRSHMLILLRRFLVLAALFFWQGGFTFYASVVVPVGQQVFGHSAADSSPAK